MTDVTDQPVGAGIASLVQAPLGRRTMMRRMAAVPVASAVAGSGIGFATSAAAATGLDQRFQAQNLRFAISGGRILDGYFASPRGKTNLDVIVVLHGENGLDAAAQETARRYAQSGYIAVAPDLGKNFAGLDHGSQVAEMLKLAPKLKRLPRSNGNVRIVSAA
jgi:carboxymethylenebutenolidase